MKTLNVFSLLCFFLYYIVSNLSAQNPCQDFNDGSIANWRMYSDDGNGNINITNSIQNIDANTQLGPTGISSDKALHILDYNGSTFVYNSVDFELDLTVHAGKCLCFDMRLLKNEPGVAYNPAIIIYQNVDFNSVLDFSSGNPTKGARFTSNIVITPDSGWVHVCAPINFSSGGLLPSNTNGTWAMMDGAPNSEWNSLLQNVSALVFRVDLTNWGDSEEFLLDNICIVDDCGIGSCCDSINIKEYQDGDLGNCCLQMTSECNVDSVNISSSGGTLVNAYWQDISSAPAASYAGLNNYTFIADGGKVLQNCFEADMGNNNGIMVYYTIYMSNGEICQDSAMLDDCPPPSSCCDSINIKDYKDGDLGNCCLQMTSECDVDSVNISSSGGTLANAYWQDISSAPAAGYAGLNNYTFIADGGKVLQNCFEADLGNNNGIMVYYTIYMSNGEICQDSAMLDDCTPPSSCCDSVNIKDYKDGDLGNCCLQMTSECDIDSVNISSSGGTLANAYWQDISSAPAVGYAGLNNYTFVANGGKVLQNCFEADLGNNSGITVYYTTYMSNGEICKDSVFLSDCPSIQCCEILEVYADTTKKCCIKIDTKCDVDSIKVHVTNGTISSGNSQCALLVGGFIGLTDFTFKYNPCTVAGDICFDPTDNSSVQVAFDFYYSNGDECSRKIVLDSCITVCCDTCCVDSLITIEQTVNEDGNCCTHLTTACEVEKVVIDVTDGFLDMVRCDGCGGMQPAVGQTNYAFGTTSQPLDLRVRVNPLLAGNPTINFTIYFINGEICQRSINLDCSYMPDCCPSVDVRPKYYNIVQKNANIEFDVTNCNTAYPNPISYINVSASPSTNFIYESLMVDGSPYPGIMSNYITRIPSINTIDAMHSMNFVLSTVNHQGTVNLEIVRADSSRCYYEFDWDADPEINPDPVDIITVAQNSSIYAVSIKPELDFELESSVKYILFGLADINEIEEDSIDIFAVSPQNPEKFKEFGLIKQDSAGWIGIGLELNVALKNDLGVINFAFTNKLPNMYCVLLDEERNIVGVNENFAIEGTIVKVVQPESLKRSSQILNLYPNPTDSQFTIEYATGKQTDVEVSIVNSLGQILRSINRNKVAPGVYSLHLNVDELPAGIYHAVLKTEDGIQSKSVVVK